ncbi:MAG TPA: carboxypeptidase-like regulatory domain-containing protein, partial [Terriglobales bacterium]|nr:carboxypeptidase-like regulatory domain-containing protein [Terriglobales bacterium]
MTIAQRPGGALGGIVRGAEGAPAAGVHVRLGMLSKGAFNSTITDRTGQYRFANLPPGIYELTFSAPGFVTQVWTGIGVAVGANRVVNVPMRAGDPAQIVRLAAPSATVAQSSGAVAGNVGSATVRNTPLNGRDWAQLATLQAGVTGVQAGNANGTGNADRGFGAAVSVSGARPDQNSYRLDGISINDY